MSIVIYAISKKKNVNHKDLVNMIIWAALALICYTLQKVYRFEWNILPIAYMALMVGAIVTIYHSNMYTVNENKYIVNEQINRVGFITFNRKLKYMGCNDYALGIFGELKNCEIGKPITECSHELKELIESVKQLDSKVLKKGSKGHRHIKCNSFEIGNHRYDSQIHTVNNYRQRCVGYTVEFRDETEHYRVIELTSRYNEELSREVKENMKELAIVH